MNKPFYILFFVFVSAFCSAQVNLVPNPSFEDTIYCPVGLADWGSVKNWYAPTGGTSDYFNSCNSSLSLVGVPANFVGNQYARTGNAYGGFAAAIDSSNIREYIQIKLNQSLILGQEYSFSCFVSKADSAPVCITEIGIALSSSPIGGAYGTPIPFSPQITSPVNNFMCDQINWTEIKGNYVALGGEQYLTIGYFKYDVDADTLIVSSPPFGNYLFFSYYFVDDVSLIENNIIIPNIFSPNNDGVNDLWKINNLPQGTHVQIYDRWGIEVLGINTLSTQDVYKWDGRTTSGLECSDGTYYYIISLKNKTYKGFIQLVRNNPIRE